VSWPWRSAIVGVYLLGGLLLFGAFGDHDRLAYALLAVSFAGGLAGHVGHLRRWLAGRR
jgi:hypothetical protein